MKAALMFLLRCFLAPFAFYAERRLCYATGKGNTTSQNFLKLLYQAVTWTGIAVNDTGTPLTNIYWGLATASVGATGNETTNEAAYGSYARQAVARTTGGHSISGQSISPVSTISFPQAASGSETETDFFTGSVASAGTGVVFHFGTIAPTIAVAAGVTPQFTTGSTITEV